MGFTGRVECVPHDMVHDSVGGWMGNVPSSAGDPVFFVHHCQIDRLYASWEAEPGVSYNWGNTSTQPSEQTWKNRMAHYVDEKGKLVQAKLGDAINTTSLGFQYDNLATPPPAQVAALRTAPPPTLRAIPLTLAAMRTNGFAVRSGGASVTLTPQAPSGAAAAAPAAPTGNPTTLVLEGLKLVRRPPAPLSVFLNLPQGTRPELNGPYYVGTLNLFNFDLGTGGFMAHSEDAAHPDHGPAETGEARFEVASVLARQRAQGVWDGGAITITISTLGVDTQGNATYVTFTGAELIP
jgi:tyrosinase